MQIIFGGFRSVPAIVISLALPSSLVPRLHFLYALKWLETSGGDGGIA